jgi:hypothetical protein
MNKRQRKKYWKKRAAYIVRAFGIEMIRIQLCMILSQITSLGKFQKGGIIGEERGKIVRAGDFMELNEQVRKQLQGISI